jgi:hypothetical protein
VAVLSITAASQGLTLTAASHVIFAEMNWTPSIMQQAEDRCHRNSQKNNVSCYYMFGKDTLDTHIYKLISCKFSVVSNMIDGNFQNQQNYMSVAYTNANFNYDQQRNLSIEEKVDRAIKDQTYGDLDDRELIKELIQTEEDAHESKIKHKENTAIINHSKEMCESPVKTKPTQSKPSILLKKKFGILQYMEAHQKKEEDKLQSKAVQNQITKQKKKIQF